MRADANPQPSRKRDQDGAERAWGAFVIAWVLAGVAAVVGWIMSILMRMIGDDDD